MSRGDEDVLHTILIRIVHENAEWAKSLSWMQAICKLRILFTMDMLRLAIETHALHPVYQTNQMRGFFLYKTGIKL